MTPENKVKRKEIIKRIGEAEDAHEVTTIVQLGRQLAELETFNERKVYTVLDLTVQEYWSYRQDGFLDEQIADICDVHPSTLKNLKKKNRIMPGKFVVGHCPREMKALGY
ncbi:hypothetical protein ACRW9N_13290 [Listeria aquatica]|uniref:hypothetical protein n=1 Tax=Listeria aquatica TaxID=1494960 RepID=UPI003EF7F48E